MKKRIYFFDDQSRSHKAFAEFLGAQGYEVYFVDIKFPERAEVSAADLLVIDERSPFFTEALAQMDTVPWLACICLLTQGASPDFLVTERRARLTPSASVEEFWLLAKNLMKVSELYRRVERLSRLESGTVMIEQMFSSLDIHHILDQCLHYFATRVEVDNIHWVAWGDMAHLLNAEERILHLELEAPAARSARMRSYRDTDLKKNIQGLRGLIGQEDLMRVAGQGYYSGTSLEKPGLVVVASNAAHQPLGCLFFEGSSIPFDQGAINEIRRSLSLMTRFIQFGICHWETRALALVDDLTELYNQRHLPTVLEHEINRAQRRDGSFVVLFMDLDFFKMVNDTRGHWVGSKLLVEVGSLLKQSIRSCDFGFRYGGDEFVLILPDTNLKGGQIVAERIRRTIEESRFVVDGSDLRLTVSIGLAAFPDHARTKESILKIADQAMYSGKRKSRNIVYIAS